MDLTGHGLGTGRALARLGIDEDWKGLGWVWAGLGWAGHVLSVYGPIWAFAGLGLAWVGVDMGIAGHGLGWSCAGDWMRMVWAVLGTGLC
jgi:hypothetical protein